MSETAEHQQQQTQLFPNRFLYVAALVFIAIGLINSMPSIPGWEDMWRNLTGIEKLKVRAFR